MEAPPPREPAEEWVPTFETEVEEPPSTKVTEVHRKIITEEKVAVAKKEEAPPKRAVPKKPVPEEKVPVPISQKVAGPPVKVPEAPKKLAREERVSIAVPKRKVSPPPEVPTEEEHWAMSEEVSISLHTEKEISYTVPDVPERAIIEERTFPPKKLARLPAKGILDTELKYAINVVLCVLYVPCTVNTNLFSMECSSSGLILIWQFLVILIISKIYVLNVKIL
ncbi:uncharacterized protein PRD47_009016 [Ara ararauna]